MFTRIGHTIVEGAKFSRKTIKEAFTGKSSATLGACAPSPGHRVLRRQAVPRHAQKVPRGRARAFRVNAGGPPLTGSEAGDLRVRRSCRGRALVAHQGRPRETATTNPAGSDRVNTEVEIGAEEGGTQWHAIGI